MLAYMSNYNVWASGNFTNASLKTYLNNVVQPNLMTAVQGLYRSTYNPLSGNP